MPVQPMAEHATAMPWRDGVAALARWLAAERGFNQPIGADLHVAAE